MCLIWACKLLNSPASHAPMVGRTQKILFLMKTEKHTDHDFIWRRQFSNSPPTIDHKSTADTVILIDNSLLVS